MATATGSYLNRSTPGVYINEIEAFGTSIVGVATAVPIFIGYTQFAGDPTTGAPLYMQPVQISSLTEYVNYFGGAAPQSFVVATLNPPPTPTGSGGVATSQTPDFVAMYTPSNPSGSPAPSGAGAAPVLTGFTLTANPAAGPQFSLYWQMRLFFANGGGNCYVVSVGSYWSDELPTSAVDTSLFLPGAITADDLSNGIAAAGYAVGPTMTVVPEACQLGDDDYGTVARAMLLQASSLQDRVAILDLPGCLAADTIDELESCQTTLWTQIAAQAASVSYGVAYAPALNTSVVTTNDIVYTNLQVPDGGDNSLVNNILTTQAVQLYGKTPALQTIQAAIATAFPLTGADAGANTNALSGDGGAYPPQPATSTLAQYQTSLDNMLQNALPIFKQIEQQIADSMNVAAPSGLIAGVWTKSDGQSGVWNAPANIALAAVDSPLYNMSDAEQAGFNMPTNGQAIDVLRAQPGRGTVVWGARTLDGNSQDYRYVQVRRTLIYIEQSIKTALQTYVFAPNDATTWATVGASISSFLTGLWQQGGLMGTKPSEAFTVSVGLGSTMTSQDILNGYMIVAVTLQMIHPAEFIELTFKQTMGS